MDLRPATAPGGIRSLHLPHGFLPAPARSTGEPIYRCGVRHVTAEDLEELGDLLRRLRGIDGLVEKRPGVFYRRSRAFLHFHADPSGFFADIRFGEDFERRPVSSRADQNALFEDVLAAVGERAPR